MISVHQAQEIVRGCATPLAAESVPLDQAQGRVLREAVACPHDLPPFDRSAMDGYAVLRDDNADEFEVVDEIRAGQSIDFQLKPGQAIRIFTGARLPAPGLKVIMREHVDMRGPRLHLTRRTAESHVRLRGEDAREGEILLAPGTCLDATALALLASIGQTSSLVSRRPRILHLTTGDEIVPPEQTPGPGQIRNSNAALITALCREQGDVGIEHIHARDDLPALLRIVSAAPCEACDLLLISGGSGAGDYDFSGELFRHLGAAIHFREVNLRPGKPLIFGTTSSRLIFGLPGNALSHFVCFHLFVRTALAHLLGRTAPLTVQAVLAESMAETMNPRETWCPARISIRDGRLECRALPWKSSGDITRLPAANALMKVPASTPQLDPGSMVELLPTRPEF